LAKRLTEKQKKEIVEYFKGGKTIDFLSEEFNCSKLTVIRNIKSNIGEASYKVLIQNNKSSIKKNIFDEKEKKQDSNSNNNKEICPKGNEEIASSKEITDGEDYYPDSSFLEISPLDYQIDNSSRKEVSSVPISEMDLPPMVYMIVDKKIELEIKLLKDFPEWSFLPSDDLNRKTIEIHFDLKTAKRLCNKEQKVIKVPNTNVFKIAAPLLVQKGISRIVGADKLIAL
tara:strand:- start:107 stop:790 length:684 start_codon:yes stop_codon:yes gene_type:complete